MDQNLIKFIKWEQCETSKTGKELLVPKQREITLNCIKKIKNK